MQPTDRSKTFVPPAFLLTPPELDKHRIAVLPLQNISSEPSDEYFADGMTEELIDRLSQVKELRVIARTSVMGYKKKEKKISEIAKELGVGSLVEGSVRKAGNRIRVTAQLIDARTEEHLWSSRYDKDIDDIFEVQGDIANQIVSALSLKIVHAEKDRISKTRTGSPSAYENYLIARHLLSSLDVEESVRKSIEYFRKSIEDDPNFAEAYLGLAEAYERLGHHSLMPFDESNRVSKEMVDKALSIDPNLAEAYDVSGLLYMAHWKFSEAEKDYRLSISLNPSYAKAHRRYAFCLASLGKIQEAIFHAEKAAGYDPLDASSLNGLGVMYMLAERDEEATKCWARVEELFPGNLTRIFFVVLFLLKKGRVGEASIEMAKLDEHARKEPLYKLLEGHIDGKIGKIEEAKKVLEELKSLCEKGYASEDQVAFVYAGLGDKGEFFKWINLAVEKHHAEPYVIKNHLQMYPLDINSDPRWDEILHRFGL